MNYDDNCPEPLQAELGVEDKEVLEDHAKALRRSFVIAVLYCVAVIVLLLVL